MLRIIVNNQVAKLYGDFSRYDLDQVASYKVHGAWFSAAKRSGQWDGRKRFYRKCPSGYFKMPSGFVDDLCKLLDAKHARYELEDHRDFISAEPEYQLHGKNLLHAAYDYQAEILDAVLAQNGGVVHAFTGAGKTVIGAAILKSFDQPSLFLTHRKVLLHQTHKAFEEALQQPVGIIGDGICRIEKFTVGMVQTLSDKKFAGYLKNLKVVVADEVHHLESKQWNKVFDRMGACHKYGLSATPSFKGPGRALIGYTGPTIYSIPPSEGIKRGVLVEPQICFFDYEQTPLTCEKKLAGRLGVTASLERLVATKDVCSWLVAHDARPMVLFKTLIHARSIRQFLARHNLKTRTIEGKVDHATRESYVKMLETGEIDVLLAQVQIMGEGVDLPYLKAVVNVTGTSGGGSSKSKNEADVGRLTMQMLGRGLRAAPGKDTVYYIDFNDTSHKSLKSATKDRKEALRDYGFEQYFRAFGELV